MSQSYTGGRFPAKLPAYFGQCRRVNSTDHIFRFKVSLERVGRVNGFEEVSVMTCTSQVRSRRGN